MRGCGCEGVGTEGYGSVQVFGVRREIGKE